MVLTDNNLRKKEEEKMNELPFPADRLADSLKKAREFRGISLKDCSRLLNLPANKIQNFEKGKYIPSLPEVEALSYIYSVPLDALFFPEKYPEIFRVPNSENLSQLMQIREKIVSTTLQIAFEKTGKTTSEIAKLSGLTSSKIKRYLEARSEIPVDDLQKLAVALGLDFGKLLDTESPVGIWQDLEKRKFDFSKIPEDVRGFFATQENWPYITVAEKIRRLNPDKLKEIAESLRLLADTAQSDNPSQTG